MKILVVEDEISVRVGISYTLTKEGYKVAIADNGIDGIKLFEKEDFDIVITDLRLPAANGIQVLESIKNISPDTGVIIITAFAEIKTAVEAMRKGAYDYISKPFAPEELIIVIDKFINHRNLELENIRLREEIEKSKQFQQIVGTSPTIQDIFEKIKIIAETDSSVIIYGESGTGKELVANAIHNLSARKNKPFIKINCAAIPETLVESELFGHEKGAFTDAVHRRKGKFEAADTGTIFFDEIGDMPFTLQTKLLRVLEDNTFQRLGGNDTVCVNVRILCATSKNLKNEAKAGRFREDLYYRLNVLSLTLPPLRERKEDIPLLVNHFLKTFCEKAQKPVPPVTPATMEKLLSYDYPGNVRELKHAIEMSATFCKCSKMETWCLPADIRGSETQELETVIKQNTPDCCENLPLPERIKVYEKEILLKILRDTNGKKKEAAKKLGVTRETLWRKLKEYEIPVSAADLDD